MKLGIAGRLTNAFIGSPLTPLFLLAAVILGIVALVTLPREEEPQISVPMVDIHVSTNGLKAEDAVKLVTEPLETIVKSIDGVEHVYSQTTDEGAMVTARFVVGTDADTAILRVHEKVRANMDRIPVGIPEPLIVGRGINDVAIVTVTLTPKPGAAAHWTANGLTRLARELQVEISKLPDIGLTYIVGEQPEQIRVEPDPEKLSLFGVTLQQLSAKIQGANRSFQAGLVRDSGKQVALVAGQTLQTLPEIGNILLTTRDGRPVYVRDVASVSLATQPDETRATEVRKANGALERAPAVTLAIAKRSGTNAVVIAENVIKQLEELRGRIFPEDVDMTITRDYGETANEKANELLLHLGLATVSIVLLVAFSIGWREAMVVAIVIPTTILLTLFASRMMGYTLNRVSLFALIFSIGILVDDAIVIIENIARHWGMYDGRSHRQAAIEAVAEVGNPTIVATLTVVAALLPMLFVSGLMGPYMSPIPANASAAMLFSFFVAVILTPWLMMRFRKTGAPEHEEHHGHRGLLARGYMAVARPVLATKGRAWTFLAIVGILTIGSLGLLYTEHVTVKLLPFDNKNHLQILADLPEGSSVEETDRVLQEAVDRVASIPEIKSFQTYAGTASPFDFNGLVRHYYLRAQPYQGDAQVNLTAKGERSRESHQVALECASVSRGSTRRPAPRSRWSSRRRGRRSCPRCSPRSTGRTPTPVVPSPPRFARLSRACPSSSTSTNRMVRRPSACASRSTRTISNTTRWTRATSTTRSPPSMAAKRSAIRIVAVGASPFPSCWQRRRPTTWPTSALLPCRSVPTASPAALAWSSSVMWCVPCAKRLPIRSSATTAAPPRW